MQLIIKPTGRCNFDCTFCSSDNMDIRHPIDGQVQPEIVEYIKQLRPTGLIVTGGEPLMVPPSYYFHLHDIAGPNVGISITSNLKDFFFHTDKWIPLFKQEWFSVVTSFQYGGGRMWDKDTPFTEDKFLEIFHMYEEYVGRKIDQFIAVITDENEDTIMQLVQLAKKLGTRVRINNAIGVGRQDTTYPRYKMFRHYIDIIDAGLEEYEVNCCERSKDMCPRNIMSRCETSIRCCSVDNNGELHVSLCDEQLSANNDLPKDQYVPDRHAEYTIPPEEYIHDECMYCELCRLCNGCNTNRIMAKQDPNYCTEMTKLKKDIIDHGWLL